MHDDHFYNEVSIVRDKLDVSAGITREEDLFLVCKRLEALTEAVLLLASVIQFKEVRD